MQQNGEQVLCIMKNGVPFANAQYYSKCSYFYVLSSLLPGIIQKKICSDIWWRLKWCSRTWNWNLKKKRKIKVEEEEEDS